MNSATKLPQHVQQAALANQKIHAIKLLRQANGLGLKEAKDLVDEFMAENSDRIQPAASNATGWVVIILIAIVCFAVYRFVSA